MNKFLLLFLLLFYSLSSLAVGETYYFSDESSTYCSNLMTESGLLFNGRSNSLIKYANQFTLSLNNKVYYDFNEIIGESNVATITSNKLRFYRYETSSALYFGSINTSNGQVVTVSYSNQSKSPSLNIKTDPNNQHRYISYTQNGIEYEYRAVNNYPLFVPASSLEGERLYMVSLVRNCWPENEIACQLSPYFGERFDDNLNAKDIIGGHRLRETVECSRIYAPVGETTNIYFKCSYSKQSNSNFIAGAILNPIYTTAIFSSEADWIYFDNEESILTILPDAPNGASVSVTLRTPLLSSTQYRSEDLTISIIVTDKNNWICNKKSIPGNTLDLNLKDYDKMGEIQLNNSNADSYLSEIWYEGEEILLRDGSDSRTAGAKICPISVNSWLGKFANPLTEISGETNNYYFGQLPLTRVLKGRSGRTYIYISPSLTVNILPYDIELTKPIILDTGVKFEGEEEYEIEFSPKDMVTWVNPFWGMWEYELIPAFEAMDQQQCLQHHGWLTDSADKWYEEPWGAQYAMIDEVSHNLKFYSFQPSCSGKYKMKLKFITISADPEGKIQFPVNPGEWEFDLNVYPDERDMEIGIWDDGWFDFRPISEIDQMWTGPGATHPGWTRLNVQPKGGYVEIWWRDHDAPRNVKGRKAAADNLNLSPEEQGFQKMGAKHIDATNIKRLDIMLSKNGATNPNYVGVTLNRDDSVITGIDAPEISDADEAPEVWFTLDGRAAAVSADGLPVLPGIYVTASGRKIKI